MCEKCLNIVVSVSQPVIVVAPLAVEHKLNICEVGAPSAAHSPDSVQVSGIRNTQLYIWRCYTTVSETLGGETQCPAHHGITTIVIVPRLARSGANVAVAVAGAHYVTTRPQPGPAGGQLVSNYY